MFSLNMRSALQFSLRSKEGEDAPVHSVVFMMHLLRTWESGEYISCHRKCGSAEFVWNLLLFPYRRPFKIFSGDLVCEYIFF